MQSASKRRAAELGVPGAADSLPVAPEDAEVLLAEVFPGVAQHADGAQLHLALREHARGHGGQAGEGVLHAQQRPTQAAIEQVALDLLPVLEGFGALPDLVAEDLLAALHVDAHGGVDGGLDQALAAAHLDVLVVHEHHQAVGLECAGVEQAEFVDEGVDDVLQVGFGHRDAHLAQGAPHAVDGAGRGEQLAQGQGSQIGSEQVLEVLLQLRVLLDGRGIGSCRLQCCLPFVTEDGCAGSGSVERGLSDHSSPLGSYTTFM